MPLDPVEQWIRSLGGLAALLTLAVIFYGLFRGLGRPAGRVAGRQPSYLRKPLFYLLASLGYFGLCYLFWRPFPIQPASEMRFLLLAAGAVLYFSGLGLVLWGRLTLGKLYFVSSVLGAQLFNDHRLITHGPFALVRHPMYLGMVLTGLGGVLLYRTWTFMFIALTSLGLALRARREEQALLDEFGEEWLAYCRQVRAWLPLRRGKS